MLDNNEKEYNSKLDEINGKGISEGKRISKKKKSASFRMTHKANHQSEKTKYFASKDRPKDDSELTFDRNSQ